MKKILRTENLWNNKKMWLIFTVVTAIAVILGCLTTPNAEVSEAASKKLKISCKKTVAVNCTTTIKTNVKAKFQSSNKKIATVNSKGVVKGKKAGKVKITVISKKNKKNKKTVTITVKNQLVITAPKSSKSTLYVGETTKIKTNLSSKFKSSNTSIATVSSSGKVVAKKAGKAKITVTSKKYKKLKKTVTITVKENPEEKTETTTENKTTESKTTEDTTTENKTTEDNTTENNTTEDKTTEDNTTEEQLPQERKIKGITAEYRGAKVPNDLRLISDLGMRINLVYTDDTTEEIFYDYDKRNDFNYTLLREENVDGKKYVVYEVSYYEFKTEMKIEVVDIDEDDIIPAVVVEYIGEPIEEGTEPSMDDISIILVNTDGTYQEVDKSKVRMIKYYDYGIEDREEKLYKYEYEIPYDYTFTDKNGNELYVALRDVFTYIPYIPK